jgi:hypothetical protein
MTTRIAIALCVCLAGSRAQAQGSLGQGSEARFEVAGGYSFAFGDIGRASGDDTLPYGWSGAFSYFLSEDVAITVEIAGHRGPQYFGSINGTLDASLNTYMAGAMIVHPIRKVAVTARLLGGMGASSRDPWGDVNRVRSIAIAFGGGMDVPLGDRFGIRAIQVDFLVSEAVKDLTPITTFGLYYRW